MAETRPRNLNSTKILLSLTGDVMGYKSRANSTLPSHRKVLQGANDRFWLTGERQDELCFESQYGRSEGTSYDSTTNVQGVLVVRVMQDFDFPNDATLLAVELPIIPIQIGRAHV